MKKIAVVSPDGKTITLTEPLMYTHLGVTVTLPDGSKFEGRAEVGLLTRNIVIRGSQNNEWNEEIEACDRDFLPGTVIHWMMMIFKFFSVQFVVNTALK